MPKFAALRAAVFHEKSPGREGGYSPPVGASVNYVKYVIEIMLLRRHTNFDLYPMYVPLFRYTKQTVENTKNYPQKCQTQLELLVSIDQ